MALKLLHRDPSLQIAWFQDSFDIFPQVIRSLDTPTILLYSFSWYASANRLARIFAYFTASLSDYDGEYVLPSSIIMLANSTEELGYMRDIGLGFQFAFVNGAFLIDDRVFDIKRDQVTIYDAVYNARPVAFKRHYLSELVHSKCFITYFQLADTRDGPSKRVDLRAYQPYEIHKHIRPAKVAEVLNSCRVGLMLSKEEGFCSASCEYLLCGLPIVSTPSRGGRAEFYDSENSIIVEPSSTAVAEAVAEWVRRLRSETGLRSRIRANTVARLETFRHTFVSVLGETVRKLGGDEVIIKEIAALMAGGSEIKSYRNFYLSML